MPWTVRGNPKHPDDVTDSRHSHCLFFLPKYGLVDRGCIPAGLLMVDPRRGATKSDRGEDDPFKKSEAIKKRV